MVIFEAIPSRPRARFTVPLIDAISLGAFVLLELAAGSTIDAAAAELKVTATRARRLAEIARADEMGVLEERGAGRLMQLREAMRHANGIINWRLMTLSRPQDVGLRLDVVG